MVIILVISYQVFKRNLIFQYLICIEIVKMNNLFVLFQVNFNTVVRAVQHTKFRRKLLAAKLYIR